VILKPRASSNANGFLDISFMPGRDFDSLGDCNTQIAGGLPRANARLGNLTVVVDLGIGVDLAVFGVNLDCLAEPRPQHFALLRLV